MAVSYHWGPPLFHEQIRGGSSEPRGATLFQILIHSGIQILIQFLWILILILILMESSYMLMLWGCSLLTVIRESYKGSSRGQRGSSWLLQGVKRENPPPGASDPDSVQELQKINITNRYTDTQNSFYKSYNKITLNVKTLLKTFILKKKWSPKIYCIVICWWYTSWKTIAINEELILCIQPRLEVMMLIAKLTDNQTSTHDSIVPT